MTLADYVAMFDRFGRHLIMIPAPSSIGGNGYDVGGFADGIALRVGKELVYTTTERTDGYAMDKLASVGRLLAGLTRETRAAQLAELPGRHRNADGTYSLDGTHWTADGNFIGLD